MNVLMILGIFTLVAAIVAYLFLNKIVSFLFTQDDELLMTQSIKIHFPVVGYKEREKVLSLMDITLFAKVSYKSRDKKVYIYFQDITTKRETEVLELACNFSEEDEVGKTSIVTMLDGNVEVRQMKLNDTKIELELDIEDTSKIPYKEKESTKSIEKA